MFLTLSQVTPTYLKNVDRQRLQMFFKMGVLKNFAIFTGKQLCWNLFLITATLLKRDSNTSIFL